MTLVSLDLLVHDPRSPPNFTDIDPFSNTAQWFVKSSTALIHGYLDFKRTKSKVTGEGWSEGKVQVSYLMSALMYGIRSVYSIRSYVEAVNAYNEDKSIINAFNLVFTNIIMWEGLIKTGLYAFQIKKNTGNVSKYITAFLYALSFLTSIGEMFTDLIALYETFKT